MGKKTEGSTPLHVALAVGSIPAHRPFALEATRLLVERGADVNAKVGLYVCVWPAGCGRGSRMKDGWMVGSTLTNGARQLPAPTYSALACPRANTQDDCLHTPLHLAGMHGLAECAALLLEKGAQESLEIKDR